MKPIKIENVDILKAASQGPPYIEIGSRKFLLIEVNQISESGMYEVCDPDEERLLLEAMEEDNPILTEIEIDEMLDTTKDL